MCEERSTVRTIYLAQKNADDTEGRGPMITVAAFTDERDAFLAAQGQGVMGFGNGEVSPLTVYDSYEDFMRNKPDAIRQRALEKLTPQERRALGLE